MESIIVSSHYNEDLRWMKNLEIPVLVASKEGSNLDKYSFDGSYTINKIPNVAREAGSYLWYIINHWNKLPKKIFFIHGHEFAYHQRVGIKEATSLYKNFDYYDFNHFYRYHWVYHEKKQSLFTSLWKDFLEKRFGSCPDRIVCDLCAQFVVDRNIIKQNSLEFYEKIYNLILNKYSKLGNRINYQIGAFFEITWHILFGMPFLLEETKYSEGSLDPKPLSNFTCDVYLKDGRVYANRPFVTREFIEISPYLYEENNFLFTSNYEKLFSVVGEKKVLGLGYTSQYRVEQFPNAAYFIRKNIHIQAIKDIKKNEEITLPNRSFIR